MYSFYLLLYFHLKSYNEVFVCKNTHIIGINYKKGDFISVDLK